jgi:pyridoxal 5'-phosphate synthase pdxS subunit
MSDPKMIKEIMAAVSIPVRDSARHFLVKELIRHAQVMAKSRIGHMVEAQILQALGVDYIDECASAPLLQETQFLTYFVAGLRSLLLPTRACTLTST